MQSNTSHPTQPKMQSPIITSITHSTIHAITQSHTNHPTQQYMQSHIRHPLTRHATTHSHTNNTLNHKFNHPTTHLSMPAIDHPTAPPHPTQTPNHTTSQNPPPPLFMVLICLLCPVSGFYSGPSSGFTVMANQILKLSETLGV